MCEHCDHPEESFADYYGRVIRPTIEQFGWFIQYVDGGGSAPSYAYTVGLTEHGCPELIATGVTQSEAAALLNDGGQALHRRQLLHGQRARATRRLAG